MSDYSKWFWTECEGLNRDTRFAHSLAEKAWDNRQAVIDEIEEIVRKERGHISYCDTPRAKKMFKAILKAIGKPDPKDINE